MNRLSIVNEKLLHHEIKILFDGKLYHVQTIGIPGYTSNDIHPYPFQSIQAALDYIAPLVKDHKVINY